MGATSGTCGSIATEVAALGHCPRLGYYFRVSPRLEDGHSWVGSYPDLFAANEARREDYSWPRYLTADPGYFTDGIAMR